MRVFLDASVLYSAARSGSLMAKFLARLAKQAECYSSAYALEEARRNLERKEPTHLTQLETLRRQLEIVHAITPLPDVTIREKDRPILEAAVAARCSHLLTSDRRDFGAFFGTVIAGVKILPPEMMAEEIGLKPKNGK